MTKQHFGERGTLSGSGIRQAAKSERMLHWGLTIVVGLGLSTVASWTRLGSANAASDEIFPAESRPSGYKLGLLATSCWMGGVWSDAEGLSENVWATHDHQRCHDLVVSVYGRFDQLRYEQIRATESRSVDDLLAKIQATEPTITRARTVALFSDIAAAAHEGMLARRAADRVKIDYDRGWVVTKLTRDEGTAAQLLQAHSALDRLLVNTDPGAADRRAIGTLFAMDRLEIASGLPIALKFYAVADVLTTMFNVATPYIALSPTGTPLPGAWLAYLTSVAPRADFRISDVTWGQPRERKTLAWTAVGQGFADRLRMIADDLPAEAVPELSRIIGGVATRLETERRSAEVLLNEAPASRGR